MEKYVNARELNISKYAHIMLIQLLNTHNKF